MSVVAVPTLQGPRLELHPLGLDARDAALVLAVQTDPAFIAHVRDSGVRTCEQARGLIATAMVPSRVANGMGMCRITVRASGQDIGMAGLVTRPGLPAPDLGYALLPAGRGLGYATEAGRLVLDHARNVLRLPRVLAVVAPDNPASGHVLARLGFRFETMVSLPQVEHPLRLFALDLLETR